MQVLPRRLRSMASHHYRWTQGRDDMAGQSDIIEYLNSESQRVNDAVQTSINKARAAGVARNLDAAGREIRQTISFVKKCKIDATARLREYSAETQVQRAAIAKQGRLVGHLAGRRTFGTTLRGQLERGRMNKKAQLAVNDAQIRNEFDRLFLTFDELLGVLYQETEFIREMRSRRP